MRNHRHLHVLKTIVMTLSAIAVMLASTGCGGGGGGGSQVSADGGGRAWTFMVFMNADNNLENESAKDIEEITRAGYSPNVTTVVQRDIKSTKGVERFVTGENGLRIVQRLPEQDMGSAETLSEFVRWATTAYPATHYCLVIWNHGTGWRHLDEPLTRGVSYDDTDSSYLNMERLKAGLSAGPQLDVIGFDACVMAMVEVAYQVRGSARYMVASEQDEPASGWDYTAVLSRLNAQSNMPGADLARVIVEAYGAAYSGSSSGVTQSALDLSRIDDLAVALDEFAGALIGLEPGRSKSVQEARDATQRFSYDDYRDLADFASQISLRVESATSRSTALEVLSAHSDSVIANTATGPDVTRAQGVSIFLPRSREYDAYSSNYERTDFATAAPRWIEFLKTY